MAQPNYLTIAEAARLAAVAGFPCSGRSIRRWAEKYGFGRPLGGRWIVEASKLDAFLLGRDAAAMHPDTDAEQDTPDVGPGKPKLERNAAILAARAAGATMEAIAAEHGITRQRVCQIIRRANPRPVRPQPHVVRALAARATGAGL